MSTTRRKLLTATAGLGLTGATGLAVLPATVLAQAVGSPLKLFPALKLDGEMFKPESFTAGTGGGGGGAGGVTLIYFWASWCPHCLRDLPTLRDKQAALKDKGFNILGVNMDTDPGLAQKWIDTHKVNFPTVRMTGDYQQAYLPKSRVTPAWWLAGRDGVVVDSVVGGGAEFVYRQRGEQIERLVGKG